ncbi:MAG: hypothetical protein CM15mP55_2830 [Hyphomicrobiales bacterium]|nr:MAG: hypothetical protein CM15mP55_2830 [Hyphomicrobiales bacterium]
MAPIGPARWVQFGDHAHRLNFWGAGNRAAGEKVAQSLKRAAVGAQMPRWVEPDDAFENFSSAQSWGLMGPSRQLSPYHYATGQQILCFRPILGLPANRRQFFVTRRGPRRVPLIGRLSRVPGCSAKIFRRSDANQGHKTANAENGQVKTARRLVIAKAGVGGVEAAMKKLGNIGWKFHRKNPLNHLRDGIWENPWGKIVGCVPGRLGASDKAAFFALPASVWGRVSSG